MTEHESNTSSGRGISRRAIVKSAVWAAPVIAVAATSPLASASTGNADVVWGPAGGSLLSLSLFNGTNLADAALLSSGPNDFEIRNGAGNIPGPLTITIVSQSESALSVSLGDRPHGVGVWEIPGAAQASWTETEPEGDLPLLRRPWRVTSTFVYPGSIGSLINEQLDVAYRYSQNGSFLSVGALTAFSLTLTVTQGSETVGTDSTILSVPLNVSAG